MNCKQAQTDIALWVGGDLIDNDIAPLERHVATCPECRGYHLRMQQVQQMLTKSDRPSSLEDSIWPALEEKIERHQQSFRREKFNGWVPAFAVAAACLLLLFFSRTISNLQQPETPGMFNTHNFNFSTSPDMVSSRLPINALPSVLLPEEKITLPPEFDPSYRDFDLKRSVELSPNIPLMPLTDDNTKRKNKLQLSPVLY